MATIYLFRKLSRTKANPPVAPNPGDWNIECEGYSDDPDVTPDLISIPRDPNTYEQLIIRTEFTVI